MAGNNSLITTLEVLLFNRLPIFILQDLIPFPIHAICANVRNVFWLLTLPLENVL